MAYQSADTLSSRSRPTPARRSSLDLRLATNQAQSSSHEPPIQEATTNETLGRNDPDQAWSQRLASASQLSHNFAHIAVHTPGAPSPPVPLLQTQSITRSGTALTVQRKITEPAELTRLQRYYESECNKMGLSPDDPACQKALQNAIDSWDNGEVEIAETILGSALVMLAAAGGHSAMGQGVVADPSKADALAKNRAEQQRFRQLIAEGATSVPTDAWSTRWKNTCEWIQNGRGGITVHSVTLAHDTAQRPGGGGSVGWYFPDENLAGSDVLTVTDHTYPDNLNDVTNLSLGETKGTEAGAIDDRIIFYGSDRFSDEHVKRTLVHEVQHVADKSADVVKAWQSQDFAQVCLARYKTEYRAHWYEGTFDNTSSTDIVQAYGYDWTARQYEIFQKIYDGYSHTKLAWDFSNVSDWNADAAENSVHAQYQPLAKGNYVNPQAGQDVLSDVDAFRAAIVAYKDPDIEGANKFNSVRVDEFYELLKDSTSTMDELNASWRKLTNDERAFVKQSHTYAPYMADINQLTI